MSPSGLIGRTSSPPETAPLQIIQPCSEACTGFKQLGGDGWSEFGLCTNPRSPYRFSPVLLGRECRNFQPSGEPPSED